MRDYPRKAVKRWLIIIAGLLLVFFILTQVDQRSQEVDLLSGHDWSHMAGATQTSDYIEVKPLDRKLMHVDTSPAQPNPPINIRGPHLEVEGNFLLEAELTGVENTAVLHLYADAPMVFDEWRMEKPSVRVTVTANELLMHTWDGSASVATDQRRFELNSLDFNKQTRLSLMHKDGEMSVSINGALVGGMPSRDIFASNKIWFGLDAGIEGSGWRLHNLTAQAINEGKVTLIDPPSLNLASSNPDSLRSLAKSHPRNLPIGAAISINPLMTDDNYRNVALGQFNAMTPENSMKFQFIHPQKDVYSFEDADSLVEAAELNDMRLHGHTLVFAKANPQWVLDTPAEQKRQVMEDHIASVMARYKGRIATWDVVNEPIAEDEVDYTNGNLGLRPHIWFEAMGESYIDYAFRAAKKADPDAELYLNDFGLQNNDERWEAMVSLVKRLKKRNVPIDGVGFQSHVYYESEYIDPKILRSHIRELANLGIKSRISEIDITGDGSDPDGQAKQYVAVLKVCLSEPTCTSFTTWGVGDKYGSTTLAERYPQLAGSNLLFDYDMQPKPAYFALQELLRQ